MHLYEPLGIEAYLDQSTPANVRWTWVGTAWQQDDSGAIAHWADRLLASRETRELRDEDPFDEERLDDPFEREAPDPLRLRS